MSNKEQIDYWNGEAARTWIDQDDALDRMLNSISDAILDRAALQRGERVTDIGCGSGALTMAAQNRVGPEGIVVGVDISAPLLENACRRAKSIGSPAKFLRADAATWRAESQADALISRFGVMFFDDPGAAFASILHSTAPGGRLIFACWRSPKENDLGAGMMKAVAHLFTPPDVKPDPTAPGPFAFADSTYVQNFLTRAGWCNIRFEPWDGRLPLTGNSARDIAATLVRMGPVGRLVRDQNVDPATVVAALTPFVESRKVDGAYALNGAVWIVSAAKA